MEIEYDVIAIIIDEELHDTVIEACEESGAKIYTAFHAKGSVGKKSFKLFTTVVEPTKEIILTLVPQSKTKEVLNQIVTDADLDNPENGFAFVVEVKELGGFTSLLKGVEHS